MYLHMGSVSVCRKAGTGKVDGVTCRVLCTWQLLGIAEKEPWLAPSGPILALVAQSGLESATLTL